MLKELILKNRSYRRFIQTHHIDKSLLVELVDFARLAPSACNFQPLKYFISNEKELNSKIFHTIGWASHLKDWPGPIEGERPSAYIVIIGDKSICANVKWDDGICAQNILLGAVEKGLGGCMIGSIQKTKLKSILNLQDGYEILLITALGKPIENIIIEEIDNNGDTRYFRDDKQNHHVPKRKLDDILIT